MVIFLALLLINHSSAQTQSAARKKLVEAYNKIIYWSTFEDDKSGIEKYDSLSKANKVFGEVLLGYTARYPLSIKDNFKDLVEKGLRIVSSEDSVFRIYSWDTREGGTMHFFRNIYQYIAGDKVYSKIIATTDADIENGGPGVGYAGIYMVIGDKKKYYLGVNFAVLSTGLFTRQVKAFTIENNKLNDTAHVIKTRTGIRNELGYEVDLTSMYNRDRKVPNTDILYDKAKRFLIFPVILENGKVTDKSIVYSFTGEYFEKVK